MNLLTTPATAKLGQIATGMQRCTGCGLNKPLAEFAPHHKSRTGIGKRCDSCRDDQIALAGRRRAATFAAKRIERKKPPITHYFKNIAIRLELASLTHLDVEVAEISVKLNELITKLEREMKK